MSDDLDQYEVAARLDLVWINRATELVENAFAALAEGYPNNARIHELRKARFERVADQVRKRSLIVAIVGEWLSAEQGGHSLNATEVREALTELQDLLTRVNRLHGRFTRVSLGLSYQMQNEAGEDLASLVEDTSDRLLDAVEALGQAKAVADVILGMVPSGGGRGGLLGALRELRPTEAMGVKLAQVWQGSGLTLAGGDTGDGLDVFVGVVLQLGKKDIDRLMATIRKEMSSKINPPK